MATPFFRRLPGSLDFFFLKFAQMRCSCLNHWSQTQLDVWALFERAHSWQAAFIVMNDTICFNIVLNNWIKLQLLLDSCLVTLLTWCTLYHKEQNDRQKWTWIFNGGVTCLHRNPPGFGFLVFKYGDDAEQAVRRRHGRYGLMFALCCWLQILLNSSKCLFSSSQIN